MKDDCEKDSVGRTLAPATSASESAAFSGLRTMNEHSGNMQSYAALCKAADDAEQLLAAQDPRLPLRFM